jgi:hypothetical protein
VIVHDLQGLLTARNLSNQLGRKNERKPERKPISRNVRFHSLLVPEARGKNERKRARKWSGGSWTP